MTPADLSETCPMILISLDVLESTDILQKHLQRMHRQMRKCRTCLGPSCPILVEFHAKFQNAIDDVMKEYGIIPS